MVIQVIEIITPVLDHVYFTWIKDGCFLLYKEYGCKNAYLVFVYAVTGPLERKSGYLIGDCGAKEVKILQEVS